MKNNSGMDRRSFMQFVMTLGGVFAVSKLAPSLASAEQRRRGGGTAAKAAGPLLADPNDPALKAMNYVHKFSDLKDKSVATEKQGVKPENQKCSACTFYVKEAKELKINGIGVGGCQLPQFAGKKIASNGYCTSWSKKA